MTPIVLTVPQVAQALQISESSVYRRMSEGVIPTVNIGPHRRVPGVWLERVVADAVAPLSAPSVQAREQNA